MFATGMQQGPQARAGPDLVEIVTEQVGFQAIGGDAKLRLLPEPWPEQSLPRPTSSLLGVASKQGLLAAAAPSGLLLATTQAIRETFLKPDSAFDVQEHKQLRPLKPQLTISTPRLSHVVFSSDESTLNICAEDGGGIAVYEVAALKQGNTDPAFQIGTEGTAVRQLAPNPDSASAHILAVVLMTGELLIANLKDRKIAQGRNGPVLKDSVSCVSWSARGKQLVAGLGNGTAVQLTPEGEIKAQIPRPPQLNGDQHSEFASWGSKSLKWPMTACLVSCIHWLSNDQFIMIYTPSTQTYDGPPDSYYALITREPKTANFLFQKMEEPCVPMGMNRFPPHQFMLRLREFPPALADALIVASVASGDVGLITNSKEVLSKQPHALNTANTFTSTSAANDSRRAQLPVKEDMGGDTSAIGAALDLSCTESVKKPIPGDEMESSATPLPALYILNNEGVLLGWWFVYDASVRAGTAYPGLIAAGGRPATATSQSVQQTQKTSAFGTFGQPAAPGSATSAFGALTTGASAFGTSGFAQPSKPATSPFASVGGIGSASSATASAFGSSSLAGQSKSPWASTTSSSSPQATAPAFGQSGFNNSASMSGAASGFGVGTGLGQKKSPWTTTTPTPNTAAKTSTVFGGATSSAASPFAAVGVNDGQTNNNTNSAFATSSFGKNVESASPFGGLGGKQSSAFGNPVTSATPGLGNQTSFGSGYTFPSSVSGSFGSSATFGTKSAFGTPALSSDTSNQHAAGDNNAAPDSDMAMDNDESIDKAGKKDPDATPKMPVLELGSSGFKVQSTFKPDNTNQDDDEKPKEPSLFGAGFGTTLESSTEGTGTVVKKEPTDTNRPSVFSLPDVGPTVVDDAPLPPDPATLPKQIVEDPPFPPIPDNKPDPTARHEVQPRLKVETAEELPPAPLPPSPTKPSDKGIPALHTSQKIDTSQSDLDKTLSPAGSSPVDLGASRTSDDRFPHESFESAATPRKPSPDRNRAPSKNLFGSTTPAAPVASYTPQSDAIKPPIMFAKPEQVSQSPRSPSPVRAQRRIRSEESPSRRALSHSSPERGAPPINTAAYSASRLPTVDEVRAPVLPAATATTTQEEPIDDDYEDFQKELSAEIIPTKRLEPFLAHQDYVGNTLDRGSVATQIERLYRDISSMIDTLGINARVLKSFIAGHHQFSDGGRNASHLDMADDWCLVEIEELVIIQKEYWDRIDFDGLENIDEMLSDLKMDIKDLHKLSDQRDDIMRIVNANADEHAQNIGRGKQLSAEQSEKIHELRAGLANVQSGLAKVENGISVLQAKLITARAVKDGAAKVPTVEAIVNTITKMTRLAEEKRGDVDVLESQIRRLRNTSVSVDGLDESVGALTLGRSLSRETDTHRTSHRTNGQYSFEYSPEANADKMDAEFRGSRGSLRSSMRNSQSSKQRPRISQAEFEAYKAKQERRKRAMDLFRDGVVAKGVRKNPGAVG